MDEKQMKQAITFAVENRCRDITPNPFLAQRILSGMQEKGQTKMKKKLSLGLILILILLLASLSALAVSLMTGQEVIEKTAVPLALGNDTGIRPTNTFSHEELVQLVETAAENGITLDENNHILLALQKGEGYDEEEAIMAICREAFDGLYYEWTVEQRHWYGDVMVQIGFWSVNINSLPQEGQMPAAEARKLALELIGKQQALPLEDTAQYRHTEEFDQEGWYFSFLPRNLTQPTCHVSFDHAGEVIDCIITPQHWEKFTEKELMYGMNKIYGYRFGSQLSWEQDAWHVFGQMLPKAEKSEKWTAEYDAYLKTTYPLPEEGDMEKAAAQKIAQQKANLPVLYESVALMMETDGRRIWKVTLVGQTDKEEGVTLTYEMDAKTGEILLEKNLMDALYFWARYVPYSVYESCIGDMMSREEALDLAVKAIHSQPGGENIPLLDETCYTYTLQYNEHFSLFTVRFQTKKLEYGNCRVNVNLDGTTKVDQFEKPGLTGDNAYERFHQVYGVGNEWDQSTWQLLEETMKGLEPETFEGKLLKATHYPAADSVKLSQKEALDIVYQTAKKGYVDIIRSVLIDAQPNPIWKAYMADETGCYLIEVDANTGEVVHKMLYKADFAEFDNPAQIYTLHRDYMPAAVREYGMARMAGIIISKEESDPWLDDPSLPILYDSQYETKVDGDTVTFLPLHEGDPTYVLTFSDNYTRFTYTKTP